MQIQTIISEKLLDIEAGLNFVDCGSNGATNVFIGRVRNSNLGREVKAVSYDAFPPLCIKTLDDIAKESIEKFDNRLRIYIAHFKGKLCIGGISVIIAVGSPHRDASFCACRYIIEELKKRAPIWKQEHYIDGDDDWLLGHELEKS